MSTISVNGADLYYTDDGQGPPVVFVHGSWRDADSWNAVAAMLREDHRVVTYDRRGHTRSTAPDGQGSIHEDVADLEALIESLGAAPAHVAGNSWGAIITLRLAGKRPDLFRSAAAHEPPAFAVVADDRAMAEAAANNEAGLAGVMARLEAGEWEAGAKTFVEEVIIGPGAWDDVLNDEMRAVFTHNARTFLDEQHDPDQLTFDLDSLKSFPHPILLSEGSTSPPMFGAVIRKLAGAAPNVRTAVIEGAGHVPNSTHPAELVALLKDFWAKAR